MKISLSTNDLFQPLFPIINKFKIQNSSRLSEIVNSIALFANEIIREINNRNRIIQDLQQQVDYRQTINYQIPLITPLVNSRTSAHSVSKTVCKMSNSRPSRSF